MNSREPKVIVVDDDEAIRRAIRLLMKSIGLDVETYASALEFLESFDPDQPGVLVLDIQMEKMSGTELQARLNELGATVPILFITGHGDVPMAVEAMKAGAIDFMQKPFSDEQLIDRIHRSLKRDAEIRTIVAQRSTLEVRAASLTPREAEVMTLVIAGKPNKVMAHDLGISERTVEIHRSRVMEKMEAKSVAQLVKMSVTLGNGYFQ